MTAPHQTRIIHALLPKIPHYADDDYRAFLGREYGVSSSKQLSFAQAEKVIETLRTLAGDNGKLRRAGVTAEGPYAGKLRALWISAFNLGVVKNADDAAMLAFVKRQTGLDHTRFLVDVADARKAIEALKSWIAREAGVEWPEKGKKSKEEYLIAAKRAVAKACCKRMVEGGFFPLRDGVSFEQEWPSLFVRWAFTAGHVKRADEDAYAGEDWDKMAAAAGKRMRVKARARKRRAA